MATADANLFTFEAQPPFVAGSCPTSLLLTVPMLLGAF